MLPLPIALPESCAVLIVIVNYRVADLVIDCLRSLVSEINTVQNARVVVVDNASGDGSVEQLRAAITAENWGDWVGVLASDHNGGYAYGNNLAIRPALAAAHPPDYIHLLNPDTIVRPGAIHTLWAFLEQHPDVGLAGSGLEDLAGNQRPTAFRFPSLPSEMDGGFRLGLLTRLLSRWTITQPKTEVPCPTDWLSGASLMIRRSVFEQIGLLDEGYFLYFEETDFCLQAQRAGWSCWYVPTSRVVHFPGSSTGVTKRDERPQRRPTYWFESRRRYFLKNHGWLYTALTDLVWTVGFTTWRLRRILQRKPDLDPPHLLGDFIRNSSLIKGAAIPAQTLPTPAVPPAGNQP